MIFAPTPKNIHVTLTAFSDGLQSLFGGQVRIKDLLPALQATVAMGVRHIEFNNGHYRSSGFQAGEDPFIDMQQVCKTAGPDIDIQILTRSICGLTLIPQQLALLEMQARLLKKHGVTTVRNVDFMNDVDNLVKTGKRMVDAGLHHQVCLAMMGTPYFSSEAHTPEFYVDRVQKLLESGLHFDSVCMHDATGTATPHTCYETAKGLKKILPPEIPLSMHTCDTASLAVACYMAGIAGGVDSIDLSVRPLAFGAAQPDVRSMAQALKGTGYLLEIDAGKVDDLEHCLIDGLGNYALNPVAAAPDARVVQFPLPGEAVPATIESMAKAGLLDRYADVLAEFPTVAQTGGAWTSATPGSQHYWSQALNNVLHGRWTQIDSGYGRSILGYFGRAPHRPDPTVVKIAAEQLQLEPCVGSPLEQAPDHLAIAEEALRERALPITEENLLLVAATITPGMSLEANAGMRWLMGQTKINAPLGAQEIASTATVSAPAPVALEDPTPEVIAPAPDVSPAEPAHGHELELNLRSDIPSFTKPVTTQCTVVEGDTIRTFRVTIEPPG
jgi:pyruvate carboxylase subunit B